MKKRALIFDLDNTVFPVPSIGHKLFRPLFDKLQKAGIDEKQLDQISRDVMRRPFQWVAGHYSIDQKLADQCTAILATLEYNEPIEPFADFALIRDLSCDKFVVTTGFRRMQTSKIRALGIGDLLKDVFIIDPTETKDTKKDVFRDILDKFGYSVDESLVIGDDPDSEIQAARELGIESVLYDKNNTWEHVNATFHISSYEQLLPVLMG